MKIILDVMGGDNPPAEIIKGALLARKELDARIALVGDESIIRDVLSAEGADSSDFDIIGSDSVIEMEDNPLCIVQKKKILLWARRFACLPQATATRLYHAGIRARSLPARRSSSIECRDFDARRSERCFLTPTM